MDNARVVVVLGLFLFGCVTGPVIVRAAVNLANWILRKVGGKPQATLASEVRPAKTKQVRRRQGTDGKSSKPKPARRRETQATKPGQPRRVASGQEKSGKPAKSKSDGRRAAKAATPEQPSEGKGDQRKQSGSAKKPKSDGATSGLIPEPTYGDALLMILAQHGITSLLSLTLPHDDKPVISSLLTALFGLIVAGVVYQKMLPTTGGRALLVYVLQLVVSLAVVGIIVGMFYGLLTLTDG
jgi:hypothetical protein